MPKRRRKKPAPIPVLSPGPLPRKLVGQFEQGLLVFSDASLKRQGGLAAVLYADSTAAPLVLTRGVPLAGSNALELQGAVFALQAATKHFPDQPMALFSDNHDAVLRLNQAKRVGLTGDPALQCLFDGLDGDALLGRASIHWVKGHATCRGNFLADQAASEAAE